MKVAVLLLFKTEIKDLCSRSSSKSASIRPAWHDYYVFEAMFITLNGCGTIPVTGVLNVLSANGSIYDPSASILNLTASVLGVTQPDGGTAHAFLDPILTIDPIFAANNPGYTLVFSEGIGNNPISPVPEPSSFVLMLSGIGAMGYVARRRQARNGPRSPSAG
jgi:hypothetical protein